MERPDLFFPEEGHFSPAHIRRSKGELVCGIDVDDVLADSIPSWIGYVNTVLQSGELIPMIGDDEWKSLWWTHNRYSNLLTMKRSIPYFYYRMLKEMYRMSEVKKNLPVREGATAFLHFLHDCGYKIVIITKRERRFSKLTHDWLQKNNLHYDDIIFSEHKHVEILKEYPSLDFMVEDNRDIASMVGSWGYRVYLVDNNYNQGKLNDNVIRMKRGFSVILDDVVKENFGEGVRL